MVGADASRLPGRFDPPRGVAAVSAFTSGLVTSTHASSEVSVFTFFAGGVVDAAAPRVLRVESAIASEDTRHVDVDVTL